jgi:hypothetical protein
MACVKSEKLRNFGRFCRFKRPHDGIGVVYIYKNGAVESGAFPGRRNRSIGPYVILRSVLSVLQQTNLNTADSV